MTYKSVNTKSTNTRLKVLWQEQKSQGKKRRLNTAFVLLFVANISFGQIYNFQENHKQLSAGLLLGNYSWVGGELGYEQKISKSDFFFNTHVAVLGGHSNSIEEYSISYVNMNAHANVGYDFYEGLNLKSFDVKTSLGLNFGYLTRTLDGVKLPLDDQFLYGVNLMVAFDYIISKRIFLRYANRTELNFNYSPLRFHNVSQFGVLFNF